MSSPAEDIFRKQSLERLSSPEQLDQLMKVTTSRAWLALLALSLLVFAGIVWGIFGKISTDVTGEGILIKSGGVIDIVAVGGGQISALYVEAGQEVQKGQIVARIAQPEIAQQLEKSKQQLEDLKAQHARILKLGSTAAELQASYAVGERANLLASMRADRDRLTWLEQHLQKQEQLFAQGLVTSQAVQATAQEIRDTREAINQARNQLRSVSVTSEETKGQKEREVLNSQLRIGEVEREIELLAERLEFTGRVVSSYSGRVLEVRASVGDVIAPGRTVMNIEPAGSEGTGLEAMIYVPLAQGKTLRPGMRAQIAPASVKQEQYGVMLGIVTSVSEFPSTAEGMKRVLQNDLLVQNLLQSVGLAPIAVKVELVPDAHTKSGYRWSSQKGPPLQLGPGTPARAEITVKTMRPVGLVIPLVRDVLGV